MDNSLTNGFQLRCSFFNNNNKKLTILTLLLIGSNRFVSTSSSNGVQGSTTLFQFEGEEAPAYETSDDVGDVAGFGPFQQRPTSSRLAAQLLLLELLLGEAKFLGQDYGSFSPTSSYSSSPETAKPIIGIRQRPTTTTKSNIDHKQHRNRNPVVSKSKRAGTNKDREQSDQTLTTNQSPLLDRISAAGGLNFFGFGGGFADDDFSTLYLTPQAPTTTNNQNHYQASEPLSLNSNKVKKKKSYVKIVLEHPVNSAAGIYSGPIDRSQQVLDARWHEYPWSRPFAPMRG